MLDPAILLGGIGVLVIYTAWREYAGDNRRDAVLLVTFGASVLLGAILFASPDLA